jgi:regulator of extracellular matrix RemA (YlzA/DUF370 family)
MLNTLINIGYNNLVSAERIVAIVNPNSVPARRLRDEAKQSGLLIDVSSGHRIRSMIISSSRHIIVSAVEVRTLASRFNEACLNFHNRVGHPVIDELMEPGQGPDVTTLDPGAYEQEAQEPARRTRKTKSSTVQSTEAQQATSGGSLIMDEYNDNTKNADIDDDNDNDEDEDDDGDEDGENGAGGGDDDFYE